MDVTTKSCVRKGFRCKANVYEDVHMCCAGHLRAWCSQLEKGELHVLPRMIQLLHKTRKQLSGNVLKKLITSQLMALPLIRDQLLSWLPITPSVFGLVQPMEVDVSKGGRSPRPTRRSGVQPCVAPPPEVELYIHLLVLLHLVDQKKLEEAEKCVETLIERIDYHEKRSLDSIAAKAFFYFYLNGRLRTATLRRQYDSQAVLIVCLLRAYLLGKHYEAAAMLVSKVTFPEGASNNDLARFLYYQGRIKAMQLDYTAAAGYFMQAIRKAPQDAAIGFKQNVQKWIVVISLLQGEIPERSVFRVPIYRKTLAPYLELTQAVRLGDLLLFNKVLNKHAMHVFGPDETLPLIVRLRQNVIKTALRQISTAYSCISIKDICKKLLLNTDQEAEYLVAKAIKDGGIEAAITFDSQNSSERYMQSRETEDIYRTTEPQTHFDTRIRYCLELHNQAVKALRYPPTAGKGVVESIEEQREREQQELEFAKEMAEEDDDDF
ncbi:26S proteasome non-ATPase regulatory subunit 3 [Wuchereria bancrofti]|uniref:26S proteasome non-ATPase regulatory subunit 3 n=1 Tax=Wuchereria bancrofti TaxID=6293 RepID=J9F4E2_WUCBA|nr:26S proteasome non-ATPase regulatory subunit 3 [Wuchereria bancrofti]